ncbi:D-alanyl-D-alanine carboxypeptidase family protein [Actinocorallia sp. B10E7]|uniref:D-alanyl-D-alanine carboxypeptidase family protein n=1 Tax=Actinocorallia sp. B10E7 TaxID=3153558 RepID=UPI00325CAE6F
MPTPRSAKLAAVLLMTVSLVVTGVPPEVAALAPGVEEVEQLRKKAGEARDELQELDKSWKDQQTKLRQSKKRLRETLEQLAMADAEFEKMRGPLAELANSAYQAPTASGTLSLFGMAGPQEALRGSADVTFLANNDNGLLKTAKELRERRETLANQAQDLQSSTAIDQAKIAKQKKVLFNRINQLTNQLKKMLKNLDLDRDTRLTLTCDTALAEEAAQFPNGLIPSKYLCKLPQSGFMLRADAALAFYKLNAAYKKNFGKDMCVRDAYRDLAEQRRIYYQRPGFAAIPGRSNHGLGQALDLCGGIQSQGTVQFNWLRANSTRYGWFHPSWAYVSPFEPWHWEFGTESERE